MIWDIIKWCIRLLEWCIRLNANNNFTKFNFINTQTFHGVDKKNVRYRPYLPFFTPYTPTHQNKKLKNPKIFRPTTNFL